MNLTKFHNSEKPLSAKQLFNCTEGKVVAIHLKKGGELKEHITKVPALIVCVVGEIVYEDKKRAKNQLEIRGFYGDRASS